MTRCLSEATLKDVITRIEPRLFQKVATVTTTDLDNLVKLRGFHSALMSDAVWKFRRDANASLKYVGVTRHKEYESVLGGAALSEEGLQATFRAIAPRASGLRG